MKVLVIGGSSAFGSSTSRMLAGLREVLDGDVELIHRPEVKMTGHQIHTVLFDELQPLQEKDLLFLERHGNDQRVIKKNPIVAVGYADLALRMMALMPSTVFRGYDDIGYLRDHETIKPKPNAGPRGRWGKAL